MLNRIVKITFLLFLVLMVPTMVYADKVLNVPSCTQTYDQWCWAGSSYTILNYYGVNVSQCEIADYTRKVATWHDFGSVNCCSSSSTPGWKCNYWNYNWGKKGSIEDIMHHWGAQNYNVSSSLSQSESRTQIDSGYPFVIRWGHHSGGGHFIVGHGIKGSSLYYMDPWYGEGKKIKSYSWVLNNNKSKWTHTNKTKGGSGPNPDPPNPDPPNPDPPSNNSCKGRCGQQAPGGCYCDNLCENYGDCCSDKRQHCGY